VCIFMSIGKHYFLMLYLFFECFTISLLMAPKPNGNRQAIEANIGYLKQRIEVGKVVENGLIRRLTESELVERGKKLRELENVLVTRESNHCFYP
jgi:hypothetical protein